jgi:hypothetical protein
MRDAGTLAVPSAKERDAVATGTVVIDGSTTNARIESLEDRNTTTSE